MKDIREMDKDEMLKVIAAVAAFALYMCVLLIVTGVIK